MIATTERGPKVQSPSNPFSITCPARKGDEVVLPAGTVVHSTNPSKSEYVLSRAQTVKVAHFFDGWIDTVNHHNQGRGFVVLPQVSWVGTGGYWCDAQITPELAQNNGWTYPELPGQDGKIEWVTLDVIPSLDEGYCNRWSAP